ncbi:hypothetical protein GCM10027262_13060 [Nocardia tengchongensis]
MWVDDGDRQSVRERAVGEGPARGARAADEQIVGHHVIGSCADARIRFGNQCRAGEGSGRPRKVIR